MIFIITHFKTYKYIKTINPQVPQIFKKMTFTYIRTLCLISEHGTMTVLVSMHRTKEFYFKILFQQQNVKATA
jgi:hypothetical protein